MKVAVSLSLCSNLPVPFAITLILTGCVRGLYGFVRNKLLAGESWHIAVYPY